MPNGSTEVHYAATMGGFGQFGRTPGDLYYEPEVFRTLVDYCGFDGLGADVASGRDGINHVLIASPRARG
jgi:hypothetical protein